MTSPLQTEVSWDGVVPTVTVTGELDTAAANALRHRQGGPALAAHDGLSDRLKTARVRAAASYERTRALWLRTESMLADNRTLRQELRETCLDRQPGLARQELRQQSAYARLVARLQTMPVIEQAKGIIMARSACGDDEAFDMLRRASQRSNVPVRELAAQLVAKSARPASSTAASRPRDPATP